MKTIALSIILVLGISFINAQENTNEVRTIFGSSEDKSNGGYGALMVNYGRVMERDAIVIGGRGAWVIDHNFGLGMGGYGFMTDPKMDLFLGEEYQVSGGYGGLIFEPIIAAKSPVHLSIPILIGAGGIVYNQHWQENDYEEDFESYEDSDAYFVLEPGVEVEFNMLKFFRLGLSVTYRYTSNIHLNYKSSDMAIGGEDMLRGFNYGIVMKFGKF